MNNGFIVSWQLSGGLTMVDCPEELRGFLKPPSPIDLYAYLRSHAGAVVPERTLYDLSVRKDAKHPTRWVFSVIHYDERYEPKVVPLGVVDVRRWDWRVLAQYPHHPDAQELFDRALLDAPIRAAQLSDALIGILRKNGAIPVRNLGGAYFVPPFATSALEPVIEQFSTVFAMRILPIEQGATMLRQLAAEAVKVFQAALADVLGALKRAKNEAQRKRALSKVQELRRFLQGYKELLSQFEQELSDAPAEITLDALAELGAFDLPNLNLLEVS